MMNGLPLFRSIETAAAITDRVLVSFSGGKDSVVTLDLCMKHFKHVEGFFMYKFTGYLFRKQLSGITRINTVYPFIEYPILSFLNGFDMGHFAIMIFHVLSSA